MSTAVFGVFVLLTFAVPVPLIAWLDRPKKPEKSNKN